MIFAGNFMGTVMQPEKTIGTYLAQLSKLGIMLYPLVPSPVDQHPQEVMVAGDGLVGYS